MTTPAAFSQALAVSDIESLKDIELRWVEDAYMVTCVNCGDSLCDAEDGDTLGVLVRVAVSHARECFLMKVPVVTKDPKQSCPVAGFGRPHTWLTGAFYWPLNDCHSSLYVGDEYVMCGACGQTERDVL